MTRNDLLPSLTTISREIKEACRRVGGTNPFNEPMFRVILAETRVTKAAGAWQIWDDAVALDDRGGINVKKALQLTRSGADVEEINAALTPASPLRIDRGMADVRLYPNEGFVLEKWKPASSFGTPLEWEAYRFEGNAALGPFPQRGDYELIAGPTPYCPTRTEVEEAIRRNLRAVEDRLPSARDRFCQLLNARAIKEEQAKKERLSRIQDFVKDGPASLYNRLSLGAGRVIQDLATKAGLVGHYGN